MHFVLLVQSTETYHVSNMYSDEHIIMILSLYMFFWDDNMFAYIYLVGSFPFLVDWIIQIRVKLSVVLQPVGSRTRKEENKHLQLKAALNS